MPAAYDYGNLLSAQARRGYEVQRHKVTTGDFGTADWQGAVAARLTPAAPCKRQRRDLLRRWRKAV